MLGDGEQMQDSNPGSTQATILVVDDDEAVRNLLREFLSSHGYGVITAGTLEEAEEILQQRGPDAIGLVITDIHLTTDSRAQEGYVLYQRWTTAHPALPFLLISGDPGSQALPAIQTGTVPYLAKPFTVDELLDAVRACLDP